MERVLYSKYNSHRSPEFRIVTEIREDDEGKYVVKRFADQLACDHLKSIVRKRKLLENYYDNVKVIEAQDEGTEIVFPFIDGISLKKKLLDSAKSIDTFVQIAKDMLENRIAIRQEHIHEFKGSADFEKVFGKIEINGMLAASPANIDSTLDNFIEKDGNIYCIDYEWVADFDVPIEYLHYRALSYLYFSLVNTLFADISLEQYMDWFDISRDKLECFNQMEYQFQQYVHGENNKYQYLTKYMKRTWMPQVEVGRLETECTQLKAKIQELSVALQGISNSTFWKMTKPARSFLDKMKEISKKNDKVYLFFRMCKAMAKGDPRKAVALYKGKKVNRFNLKKEEEKQQKETKFEKIIKFSILVPLYNTPRKYLKAMIESVVKQTYSNWELCLVDGSDSKHNEVQIICTEYAKKYPGVRYQRLEENRGISENTNVALNMATGDYIGLLDHDDMLHPSALFEYMYAICKENADFIFSDETNFYNSPRDAGVPHFKPNYSPDTLRSYNYICHFTVFSKKLLERTGAQFKREYDGSQDYDLVLRLTEQAEHIVHIPKVLYFWRIHSDSTSADVGSKPYIIDAAKLAISEHLKRIGLEGTVQDSRMPSSYKIQYRIKGNPLISIIIPNKDHIEDLDKCIRSIQLKTSWKNWEIVVVENNSTEKETNDYYKKIEKEERIKVVKWDREFNYSSINNFGAHFARGEYLLLLNNDTEIITADWLEQMLMFAQRKDVGAVGAMLYYPDDTIQHAGIILGLGGLAAHSHRNFKRGDIGYSIRLTIAQNLSAVTGACMMIRRNVWDEVGGLDEKFAVAYNDVDICMRIREAGYLVVWTPYAELYHYESKSRGYENTPEKIDRLNREKVLFTTKWRKEIDAGDPYYNQNLTLDKEDFSIKD